MADRTGKSVAKLELHAPYHPYISVRIFNKYYNVDASCSSRSDKYVHWITHFHFDHIRSSIAGGADFLLHQDEVITIYAPFDQKIINDMTCFDMHRDLYNFHSRGKRVLTPVNPYEKLHINNSILTAIPLVHSFMNLALYIEKNEVGFTALITGDWKGSLQENRSRIIDVSPDLLVTECRYFEASKYEETEDRYHVHFQDLLEIQKELPRTTIVITHVSRTYQDVQPLVEKSRKKGFIFAKKVLFYEDFADYEIIEEF